MTDKINDGGPAFPQHDLSGYGMGPAMRGHVLGDDMSGRYEVEGISMRDYFAAHADLKGVEFRSAADLAEFGGSKVPTTDTELLELGAKVAAKLRYLYADAMIAERSK